MKHSRVMHLLDSLQRGGKERVAVNLVNLLPRDRFSPYLCTTREAGPLEGEVAPDVKRLHLERRHVFDIHAVKRLITFLKENQIRLLHAHGPTVFIGWIATFFPPYPCVVWHVHSGVRQKTLAEWAYRVLGGRMRGVIIVKHELAEWTRDRLKLPTSRVWYVPNCVCEPDLTPDPATLPGLSEKRIVCVANLRPPKDHLTLLRAFALVKNKIAGVNLHLVGTTRDVPYLAEVTRAIVDLGLSNNVFLLGERADISAVLRACDIAVLSSTSEGFPLALLEYGMSRLPVVATKVGECAEVLGHGSAGMLVAPRSPDQMAEALVSLLVSAELRAALGERLYERIQSVYSARSVTEQICSVYDAVLCRY